MLQKKMHTHNTTQFFKLHYDAVKNSRCIVSMLIFLLDYDVVNTCVLLLHYDVVKIEKINRIRL